MSVLKPWIIELPDGGKFAVRRADVGDVRTITELIHGAFEIWKKKGLSLSPMRQSEMQTLAYINHAFLVEDIKNHQPVGTFAVEPGIIERTTNGTFLFQESDGAKVEFAALDGHGVTQSQINVLVPKRGAFKSGYSNRGLGNAVYAAVESAAAEKGLDGVAIETVREATWLYEWYIGLGMKPIATCKYPESQADTILMLKRFAEAT